MGTVAAHCKREKYICQDMVPTRRRALLGAARPGSGAHGR